MRKNLSSPNFFILLTPFTPIKRFLTDSTLLGGILPCEIRSFWHPGTFRNFSGTEVRAVFVRRIFQKKISFFNSSDLAETANSDICICVCLYFCICVFLVFLCVFCVFVFVFEAYLCISSIFCCPLSSPPHQPAFAGKRRR